MIRETTIILIGTVASVALALAGWAVGTSRSNTKEIRSLQEKVDASENKNP